MAADSSTLSPTATPVAASLGSYLAYPEWKKTNSTPGTPTGDDLPNYLDYYRVESLKRGELTQQKESEIQDYYVNWYTDGKPVGDEEYGAIANMSTGYVSGTNQEASLVSRVFPHLDWAGLESDKQSEYLNRSKKALLQAGELPYASILEGDLGVVHIGNYGHQGTTTDRLTSSGNQALEAYHAGAIDPRDLWQVAEGLEESGIPNKTKFQADVDKRDLDTLKTLLLNPESETAQKISEAIQSTIDLDSYRKEGSWWNQLWADRPEDINQIIVNDLPSEIAEIQPILLKEIGKREGWGDVQMSGLDPDNAHRYSNERLFKLVKELAISHANNHGVFKYESNNNENNIRITPMGLPIAHPELMKRGDFNDIIVKDTRLSDRQRQSLKVARSNYIINSQLPAMDKMWTQEHLDSVVGDRWAAYKTENPNGLKEDPEAFYDNFINNKDNYDQSKNWWGGVRSSVPNALIGIGASVGALLGDKKSAKYLADHQKKEASRKQTAGLFGEKLGFGYDAATMTSQVVSDIGASILLSGPLSKLGKLSKIGSLDAKNIMGTKTAQVLNSTSGSKAKQVARARVRSLIEKSGADSAKTKTALNAYNDFVARQFGVRSSAAITALNRSAGSMYASIYNSLPEDMSHEEKHDKALGPGLVAGTVTAGLVTAFSALNMGGTENIISKYVTYRQLKNSLNSIGGAEWVNHSTTKALLKKPLKNKLLELVSAEGTGVLGKTVRGAIHEGLEEGLDEFINSFVETSATNEFLPMTDRINHSMYAASLGGLMGGTVTLAGNYTVGLDKIKALAQSKSFDPQKQAEDIAFENAAIALQESGLDISADALRAARDEQVKTDDTVKAEEATQELQSKGPELLESQVQESKAVTTTNIFSPDFSGEVSPELIESYIESWKPSNTEEQNIFVDFKEIKDKRTPMRVGIISESDVTNPWVAWEIDSEALAKELNGISPESRQETLDKYIAHELVHVSEANFIKERWKKYNQENEKKKAFVDFYRDYQIGLYEQFAYAERKGGWPILREAVATHLGIKIDDVYLPMIDVGEKPSMQPDEIISEFTRQFLEVSQSQGNAEVVAEKFKNLPPAFLEHLQGMVGTVRSKVDEKVESVPSENKGVHEGVTESLREYLNGVEEAYVDILRSSLAGKYFDFNVTDPGLRDDSGQEVVATPEAEPIGEPVSKYDEQWGVAVNNLRNNGELDGERADPVKREESLIDIYRAHLLAKEELQFTEDSLNGLIEYLDTVRDERSKETDTKGKLPPGIGKFKQDGNLKIPSKTYNKIKPAIEGDTTHKVSTYLKNIYGSDLDAEKVSPTEANKKITIVAPDLSKLWTEGSQTEPTLIRTHMNELVEEILTDIDGVGDLSAEFNYNTESFHAPIVVTGDTVIFNVYGLTEILKAHENDKNPIAKPHATLAKQIELKKKEAELLELTPDAEIKKIIDELDAGMLSFLSKEASETLATEFKSKEDIQDDEGNINTEVAKEIIINFAKKYSSEALLDSPNIQNTFSLMNAFPSLESLVLKKLNELNVSKLSNKKLNKAREHLQQRKFKDTHSKNLPWNSANREYSLDLIRTVVSESAAPNEEGEVDEEHSSLEQLLEIPLGDIGPYSAPAGKKTGWIKKFWQSFLGAIDPRWKREMENRRSVLEAIKAESEQYITAIDWEVEKVGGWTPEMVALMQKASGRTDGNEVSEEFEAEADQSRKDKKDNAKKDESNDAQALKKAFREADKEFNEAMEEEKMRVSEQNKRITKAAMAELAGISPELANTIRTAREKITEASRLIAKKLKGTGLKQYADINVRFDAQEGFYLTRTHRIFGDPKYSAAIKDKDVSTYDGLSLDVLRVNAGKAMVAEEKRKLVVDLIAKKDKQAVEENNLDWLRKSEFLKNEEVENGLVESGNALFKGLTESEFADHFITHIKDYDVGETDILKRKKKIPKAIRQAMGEVELPAFNIVQTLSNVKQFANSIFEGENLLSVGRQGDEKSNWWFFTTKEYKDIISEEGQKNNPDLYEAVRNFKPVFDEDGKTFLPTSMRASYNKLANQDINYRVHPDIAAYFTSNAGKKHFSLEEETASTFNNFLRKSVGYSLGVKTMGSGSYYTRNIVGNLTYFPLSQGMSPKGIDKMWSEGLRAVNAGKNSKIVDEAYLELLSIGVMEPEFTSAMLNDILDGKITSESIKQQNFAIFSELQKVNGLPEITEDNDPALIKTLQKALTTEGLKWPRKLLRTAQRLSLMTDSWYKIGYYMHEKSQLKKARQYDIDNNITGPNSLADATDARIVQIALDVIKKTAQYYSQSSPLVDGWNQSSAGVLFAPYLRFRMEVPRIMFNTYKQGWKEVTSGNPVLKRRGAKRLAGMSSVGTLTATGSVITEPIFVAIMALMGHSAADDLDDEMRLALQLSVPSYLRDHTFLYTKKDGKYYSWDLTYLNPYAMWLDAFPAANRMMKEGKGPVESYLSTFSKFTALPFVEGQIATQSFFNTMQNRNSKGEPIWFDNDDPLTKAMKAAQSFGWEAYGPPSAKVLRGIGASAEAGQFDMGDAFRDLFHPLKGYEVDPTASFTSMARYLRADILGVRKKQNKLVRDKPMDSFEIDSIARDNVNISKSVAAAWRRYAPKWVEMGVSPELVEERGRTLFTLGRYDDLGAGVFSVQDLSPAMIEIMGQRLDLREMKKKRYEDYLNSISKYMEKAGGSYFLED